MGHHMIDPGKKPEYLRMTKDEISSAFNRLGLSPNQFCRLTGAAYGRVTKDWLEGRDVPPWVPVLLSSWLASSQAFEAAKIEAETRLISE